MRIDDERGEACESLSGELKEEVDGTRNCLSQGYMVGNN